MITIEEMERSPVSPEEFREAYDTIRRYCMERNDNCYGCHMANVCYSDCMPPKNWPELEEKL